MAKVSPRVILFGHDLEALQNCGSESGSGVAQLIDVERGIPEVVHLYPLASKTCISDRQGIPLAWRLDDRQISKAALSQKASKAILWIDTRAKPVIARCNLHLGNAWVSDLPVEIPQTGAIAFTRNAPILETQALNSASVLCIGLGSGGSIVADQLARAGVGHFTLWDMDRLESHNIGRHLCTLDHLGRRKVFAVRDHIKSVNPAAEVDCVDKDILKALGPSGELESAIIKADCVIVGTDNNASRFAINEVALQHRKVALYGRAFTRAAGGDVIQVIPTRTPCYACHVRTRVVDEEVSSSRDAERIAYADTVVPIEPGLIIDIHPIANMLARLALLRLCETFKSSLKKAAKETRAPLYLWANRREGQFSKWRAMGRSYDRLAVLRWYAIGVLRNKGCMTCKFTRK